MGARVGLSCEGRGAFGRSDLMDGQYDLSMAQLDPAVGLEVHREALATVHGWFRQAGLTAEEARLLVERFNAAVDPYSRPAPWPEGAGDRLAREADDYLRALWGADYPQNLAAAETAIERLGGAQLEEFLRASGLRFDPFVLRTLAAAALRNGWDKNKEATTAIETAEAAEAAQLAGPAEADAA